MDETRTFVFIVEGDPYVGDIRSYARAVEAASYSGCNVSTKVWFVVGDEMKPAQVESSHSYTADDYSNNRVVVAVPGSECKSCVGNNPTCRQAELLSANYRIDLRV